MADILLIPATEIPAIAAAGGMILDVRTRGEHVERRLAAAHELVPLVSLDPKTFMEERGLDAETPVFILCHSDARARAAARQFADAGYPNAVVIEGGLLAAEKAGVPLAGVLKRKSPPPPRP